MRELDSSCECSFSNAWTLEIKKPAIWLLAGFSFCGEKRVIFSASRQEEILK